MMSPIISLWDCSNRLLREDVLGWLWWLNVRAYAGAVETQVGPSKDKEIERVRQEVELLFFMYREREDGGDV